MDRPQPGSASVIFPAVTPVFLLASRGRRCRPGVRVRSPGGPGSPQTRPAFRPSSPSAWSISCLMDHASRRDHGSPVAVEVHLFLGADGPRPSTWPRGVPSAAGRSAVQSERALQRERRSIMSGHSVSDRGTGGVRKLDLLSPSGAGCPSQPGPTSGLRGNSTVRQRLADIPIQIPQHRCVSTSIRRGPRDGVDEAEVSSSGLWAPGPAVRLGV